MSSHCYARNYGRPLRCSLPVLFVSLLILPVLFVVATPVLSVSAQAGTIYYVNSATGDDSNLGTSWGAAFATLQQALATATSGAEIWVAAGTYTPTTCPGTCNDSERQQTFQLESGVAIYGGFAGTPGSEGNFNARTPNPATNRTVLSGEIGDPGNSDNSYHVVTGDGTNPTTILDGFTITGGNADPNVPAQGSDPRLAGGGMTNTSGSPTLRNIIFENNSARLVGGGLYNVGAGSDIRLTNVIFRNNQTTFPAFSLGAGMYNNGNGNPPGAPVLLNVLFTGNRTPTSSGTHQGGALFTRDSTVTITNTTIVTNTAREGSGIYILNGSVNIRNSVIWGNTPANSQVRGTPTSYSHSLVQGRDLTGIGTGNLDGTDPSITTSNLFVDFAGGNFYPAAGSALFNVGSNSHLPGSGAGLTDLLGQARVFNTTVDIGAFEFDTTNPTAVELLSFVVVAEPAANTLTWTTLSEINVSGYTIQQNTDAGWVQVSPFLPAEGNGATYRWQARDPTTNAAYRLEVIDTDQTRTYHLPDNVVASTNKHFLPLVVR